MIQAKIILDLFMSLFLDPVVSDSVGQLLERVCRLAGCSGSIFAPRWNHACRPARPHRRQEAVTGATFKVWQLAFLPKYQGIPQRHADRGMVFLGQSRAVNYQPSVVATYQRIRLS